jgi:hypothetical protein
VGSITVLRPSGTASGTGWTPTGGTLASVTSDDNDATYATWGGSGSALLLATPVDSPPAGERRHQVRVRARGEDGDAWWAVRVTSGALIAGASAQFPSSPTTVAGSWGFGAAADGPAVLFAYVTGQSTGVKINEIYLDVDSREAPTLTPQVINGAGVVTTTISDTTQPVIHADDIDLDDLNARQYRYWVTLNGAIVWDTGIVSGAAADRQTAVLDNGSYVAHLQIWTTLGQNLAYPSAEETIAFSVQVGQIDPPENPTVDPVDGTPFYEIEACAPDVSGLDDGVGYIEIQRVDCPVGGYLALTGSGNSYAATPDPGGAPVDLDAVVHAGRDDDWLPTYEQTLAAHYNTAGDNRTWRFAIRTDGKLQLVWGTDGTAATLQSAVSTEQVHADPNGDAWVRVQMASDVAGVWNVTFLTRETEDSDWVQLGEVVVGLVPAPLYDAVNTPYTVGAHLDGPFARYIGRIYSVEVRDAIDGALLVNPDFQGRLNGTTQFTDGLGNLWTVHPPASVYSPTSTRTVAMLGPLESEECAMYVDYTLPRSGVGLTCDHAPEPCCSYYRSRTIGREDGDLRISDWSDAYDPGVPSGIIMLWPSTNATIPTGWDRVTALDGRYAKGIVTADTEPGTTGGAATHSHTTPGHTHDTSHIHTTATPTAAATGSVGAPNTAGALKVLATHTHSRPSTDSATVASGSTSPGTDTVANDPARLTVIYIQSDGTPFGIPDGALALTSDISLAGWADYGDATNRFLKGAAAAGDGGATAASALASHTHTVSAHTHTGTAHAHTSAATGSASSTLAPATGAGSVTSAATHTHPITVASASTAALVSASGGASGAAAAQEPPYVNVRVQENTSGGESFPAGIIGAWRSSLGSIPNNWQICDGTNGTPDLTARYPRGATASIGTTGGSPLGHTHTGSSHTHTTSTHSHTSTTGASAAGTTTANTTATVNISTAGHTHVLSDTNTTTPTVVSTSTGTLASSSIDPLHEEVAFVQMMEEPTPPPDPDTFCLVWSDEEHLIRTTGPDGPLWSVIKGKFEWDVDRPFTAAMGVNGSRFVTSAAPGGRNLSMSAAVESEAELATLRATLARPLVLISPSDANEVWAAPVAESVRVVKVGRSRQVTARFIGTGPEPAPQLADVG